MTSGASATSSGGVAALALRIGRAPANVSLQVATNSPAEGLQGLRKRRNAGLSFQIVFGEILGT